MRLCCWGTISLLKNAGGGGFNRGHYPRRDSTPVAVTGDLLWRRNVGLRIAVRTEKGWANCAYAADCRSIWYGTCWGPKDSSISPSGFSRSDLKSKPSKEYTAGSPVANAVACCTLGGPFPIHPAVWTWKEAKSLIRHIRSSIRHM